MPTTPTTPTKEDYIEAVWLLIHHKGYARVTDLAGRLGVNNASVSKMIQKLDDDGLVIYERYRGMELTAEGYRLGEQLSKRHQILETFLGYLGVGTTNEIYTMVEGIEHFFPSPALIQVRKLVQYIERYPEWWDTFKRGINESAIEANLKERE